VCGTDWTRERGEWLEDANTFGEPACGPGEVQVVLEVF